MAHLRQGRGTCRERGWDTRGSLPLASESDGAQDRRSLQFLMAPLLAVLLSLSQPQPWHYKVKVELWKILHLCTQEGQPQAPHRGNSVPKKNLSSKFLSPSALSVWPRLEGWAAWLWATDHTLLTAEFQSGKKMELLPEHSASGGWQGRLMRVRLGAMLGLFLGSFGLPR